MLCNASAPSLFFSYGKGHGMLNDIDCVYYISRRTGLMPPLVTTSATSVLMEGHLRLMKGWLLFELLGKSIHLKKKQQNIIVITQKFK